MARDRRLLVQYVLAFDLDPKPSVRLIRNLSASKLAGQMKGLSQIYYVWEREGGATYSQHMASFFLPSA